MKKNKNKIEFSKFKLGNFSSKVNLKGGNATSQFNPICWSDFNCGKGPLIKEGN